MWMPIKQNSRSGYNPYLYLITLLGLMGMLHKAQTDCVKRKEDLFNLTILMPKINTTKVCFHCAIWLVFRFIKTFSTPRKINTFIFNTKCPMTSWWSVCAIEDENFIGLQSFSPVLVGYTPVNFRNAIHHILTAACANPQSNQQIWLVFNFLVDGRSNQNMNCTIGEPVQNVCNKANKQLFMTGLEKHHHSFYPRVHIFLLGGYHVSLNS